MQTIRELIIQGIVAQLETIRLVNGYNSDIGQVVQRGLVPVDLSTVPAVVFVQPGVESSTREFGQHVHTMPVQIDAVRTLEDRNASVQGEEVLGDLVQCIVGGRESVEHVEDIDYTGGGIEDYPTKEDQLLWVQVSVDVVYTTLIGNPYSQQ